MRPTLPVTLVAALFALGACAPDDDPGPSGPTLEPTVTATPTTNEPTDGDETDEPTATESPTSDEPTPLDASCENADEGYALSYPADWQVNDPGTAGPCRVFHPEPFTLEEGTEIPENLAIVADMEAVAMDRMTEDNRGSEELRREELTVAGQEALLLELRATQDAPLQEPGTLTTQIIVRVGPERTFVLRTTDRGDVPYEEKQQVLRRMADTLQHAISGPGGR